MVSGIELAFEEAGHGAPLLWLHGFLGCGADWRYVFDAPPPGFRLVAPDLPGHGASPARPGPYSFRASAEDVLSLLDRLDLPRVSIIGASGGGITALHVATLQPDRVSRMVVVSAPPSFPEQARALQRNFSEGFLGEAERAAFRARHRRDGQAEALIGQARELANSADPDFSAADLGRITAETLVVFGDRDPLYPVSLGCELHAAIPKSWLWVIPNAGHSPMFASDAPRFRDTVQLFLDGRWRS